LYAAIADGDPLEAALAAARGAIRDEGNLTEWGTPVLYSRAPDGRLFDLTGQSRILDLERKARQDAERKAREDADRQEAERKAQQARQARQAREKADRQEAERKAQQEADRQEADRQAREKADRQTREQADRRAQVRATGSDSRAALTLFQCKATKRFPLWFHSNCDLTVTTAGIEFLDPKSSKHSFKISTSQLKGASIRELFNSDLIVELASGQKYEIGLSSQSDRQGAEAAIRELLR
jgi:multidrug efflux pump subunit AcrA (membrane-fusion protein)